MEDSEKRKAIELLKEMRNENKDGKGNQEGHLGWMYKGPSDLVDREEYLLGKTIDKTFEALNSGENSELLGRTGEQSNVPKRLLEKTDNNEQVDIAKKILEDPLYAIKQKEMEARKKLLNNPVKLKQIKQLLLERSKQNNSHKKSKKKSKKKSEQELNLLILKKLKKFKDKEKRKALKKIMEPEESSSESSSPHERKEKKGKSKRKRKTSDDDSESDSSTESSSSEENRKTQKRKKKKTRKEEKNRKKKKASSDSESSDDKRKEKSHKKSSKNKKHSRKSSSSSSDSSDDSSEESSDDSSDNSSDESSNDSSDNSEDNKKEKNRKCKDKNNKSKSKHDRRDSRDRGRQSRSDNKREDRYRMKERGSKREHSAEGRRPSKNYGLMMPDGSKPDLKRRHSPVRKYEKKIEAKAKYVPPPPAKPLSEKEREEKLKEMMKDAKLRKEDRERNLANHRKKEDHEENIRTYDDDFMRRQMSNLTSEGTMADRIKSNINNIQRSKSSMDSSFMRK